MNPPKSLGGIKGFREAGRQEVHTVCVCVCTWGRGVPASITLPVKILAIHL